MFQKIITNLKNSLPAPIRGKLGIAEENDDESNELNSEDSEIDADTSSENSSESEEEKKKKRNSMLLRVVVILGMAYYAVDEFVLKPEDPAPEAKTDPRKNRKKVVKKDSEEAAVAASENSNAGQAPAQNSADTQVAQTSPSVQDTSMDLTDESTSTQAPIENVNIIKNETADQKLDQLVNDVDTSSSSTVAETPAQEPVQEPISTPPVESSSESMSSSSSNTDSNSRMTDNSMDIPTELPAEQVTIPSQPAKQNSMASKISEESVQTAPPAYDQVGRGLVYNCKDKYWACLNKTAYVTCNKNMKWNKSNGSPAECVVQNIYSSDEDCAKVQKYNVSSNTATAFCQN